MAPSMFCPLALAAFVASPSPPYPTLHPTTHLRRGELLQRTFSDDESSRHFASRRRGNGRVLSAQDDESSIPTNGNNGAADTDGVDGDEFFRQELARLESLEDELEEFLNEPNESNLESYDSVTVVYDEDDNDAGYLEYDKDFWEDEDLAALLQSLPDDDDDNDEDSATMSPSSQDLRATRERTRQLAAAHDLEQALLRGVVPISANVGTDCLPGDFGFDPLHLSEQDWFPAAQAFLLSLLPGGGQSLADVANRQKYGPNSTKVEHSSSSATKRRRRPRALVLRDYREAEIRHSRVAMLAAAFWPLQELLDRLVLDPDQYGPLIYGPVTLPYFPLLMTAIMLLLGYLDIYSQAIKDMDQLGEAFQPGDCFWDPLKILDGAPPRMQRNMQERELLNGRVAMLAVAVYTWEEAMTHQALVDIPGNELLLKPAYQVPFIQEWLDERFARVHVDIANDDGTVSDLLTSACSSIESCVGTSWQLAHHAVVT